MNDEKYLAALRTHWKPHNVFHPMSQLCDVVGLSAKSSIFALVGRLTEAGYLQRLDGRIAPTKKLIARPLSALGRSCARGRAPLNPQRNRASLLKASKMLCSSYFKLAPFLG